MNVEEGSHLDQKTPPAPVSDTNKLFDILLNTPDGQVLRPELLGISPGEEASAVSLQRHDLVSEPLVPLLLKLGHDPRPQENLGVAQPVGALLNVQIIQEFLDCQLLFPKLDQGNISATKD